MIFIPLASSSNGNAYLVTDGNTTLLLECGLPFRKLQKLIGFRITDVNACLISHEHKDHSKCFLDIIKSGIPVYASRGTADVLVCNLMQPLEDRKEVAIGTFDVLPFATFHDSAEPLGFLIRSRVDGEKLAFVIDTVNIAYQFPGLSIMAIECNHMEEILGRSTSLPDKVKRRITNSHMEVGRTCAYLKQLDKHCLRAVYLMHLSDRSADAGLFQDLAERSCPGVQVTICPKERT